VPAGIESHRNREKDGICQSSLVPVEWHLCRLFDERDKVSDCLDHRGDALSSADAQHDESTARPLVAHRAEQAGREHRASRADLVMR
jgi:hypothetical protein